MKPKHTPTGFESDPEWVSRQVKALKLLRSLPTTTLRAQKAIDIKINWIYRHNTKRRRIRRYLDMYESQHQQAA